jgi:hypothetical protein
MFAAAWRVNKPFSDSVKEAHEPQQADGSDRIKRQFVFQRYPGPAV